MDLPAVLLCFAVLNCMTDFACGVCSNITYTIINDIRRIDLCDRGVIKDGSWYRFKSVAGDKIPDFNPGIKLSETYVPIWINGKHPNKLSEKVNRTVCVAIPFRRPVGCRTKFDIKVISCSSFFLYRLREPQQYYAYCVGRCQERYFTVSGVFIVFTIDMVNFYILFNIALTDCFHISPLRELSQRPRK